MSSKGSCMNKTIMEKSKKSRKRGYFLYDFGKITAVIPCLLWYRMKRLYASPEAKKKIKGGAILISNHSGNVDPIAIMTAVWYRRHHFIATKELFEGKLKRFMFEIFHCIEIDRDNVDMNTFRTIVDHLKGGKLVSMFPEGHMTHTEEVQKFKSGMVLMAFTAKKPIVPMYIKKRKSLWQRQVVVLGEPIDPADMLGKMPSLADMDKVAAYLHEQERALKAIADQH